MKEYTKVAQEAVKRTETTAKDTKNTTKAKKTISKEEQERQDKVRNEGIEQMKA